MISNKTHMIANTGLYSTYNSDDDYQPCSKKIMPSLFAWFLLLSTSSAYFTLVLPMYIELFGADQLHLFSLLLAGHSILFLFVVINFLIATFMDPGRFPKVDVTHGLEENSKVISNNQSTTYKNVLINDINVRMKWCTTCQFYRPPRSSHCGVCNACIDTMDHHCPWVCNCIARRNYKYFLQFLVSLTIHMLIILGLAFTLVLYNKENLNHIPVIVSFVLIVIISVLIFPIGGLTVFHLVLVSRGRTTNEQVTGKFRTGVNPFDVGCVSNWLRAMCTPPPLSYIHFKRERQREREYYQTKLLISKYNLIKYNNNSSSNTASLKAATQKLANNSTNSIIYTAKPAVLDQPMLAPPPPLPVASKKQQLRPVREEGVHDENAAAAAYPPLLQAQASNQDMVCNKNRNKKSSSKSSTASDEFGGGDSNVWLLDQRKSPASKYSLLYNKKNANFKQQQQQVNNVALLQNGSYRAMDKNVGTNLEQHLARNAVMRPSSNTRLTYAVEESGETAEKRQHAAKSQAERNNFTNLEKLSAGRRPQGAKSKEPKSGGKAAAATKRVVNRNGMVHGESVAARSYGMQQQPPTHSVNGHARKLNTGGDEYDSYEITV